MKEKENVKTLRIVITTIVSIILVLGIFTLVKLYLIDNNGISNILTNVETNGTEVKKLADNTNTKIDKTNEAIDDLEKTTKSNYKKTNSKINSVIDNDNKNTESITANDNTNKDTIVENADENKNEILSNSDANRDKVLTNSDANRDKVLTNSDANRDQVLTNSDANRDQVLTNSDANRDKLLSNSDINRDKIISNTDLRAGEINTNIDKRFNKVDLALEENNKDINEIITSLSVNGTVYEKINNIENNTDRILNKIGNSSDTDGNTIFHKLNTISNTVDTINTNTAGTKELIERLSTKAIIGEVGDSTTTDTVFGRLNQIRKLSIRIENKLETMDAKLDSIESMLSIQNLNYVNADVITALADAYEKNAATKYSTYEEKMTYIVAWLRNRGYLK